MIIIIVITIIVIIIIIIIVSSVHRLGYHCTSKSFFNCRGFQGLQLLQSGPFALFGLPYLHSWVVIIIIIISIITFITIITIIIIIIIIIPNMTGFVILGYEPKNWGSDALFAYFMVRRFHKKKLHSLICLMIICLHRHHCRSIYMAS